jgi:hypothetical protein
LKLTRDENPGLAPGFLIQAFLKMVSFAPQNDGDDATSPQFRQERSHCPIVIGHSNKEDNNGLEPR